MNEKIKEILTELTSIQLRYTKPLSLKDSKDELIDDYEELVFKMLHIITNLQEENERLKEKHFLIQAGRFNGKTYIMNLEKEKEDYKSRCEKIRNYVNSTKFVYDEQYKKKDKIETIINGGDEK